MRKLKLFFAFMLMAVLSIGQVWATDIVIDLDLTKSATYPSGFPTATGTKTGTYSFSGYDFSFSCNDGVYFANSSYLMIGKSTKTVNSYITLPAIENYKLSEVKLTATGGTSTNVAASIQDGSGNVLTGGTGWAFVQSGNNTWTLTETSANTAYKVCIYKNNTNNSTYNAQVAGLKLTYTPTGTTPPPAKTLTGVTVSGAPTKTSYYAGDNFDPAGLTVTGTYSDESTAPITSGITWSYNPAQALEENQTSIGVTATVNSIASAEYPVSITVAAAPAAVEYALFSGDIEEGDYVIYYDGKAMKNTIASNRFSYLSVAPANDKITNPDASIVWHIAQNNAYWTLYNESVNKYAGATGSNNQGKLVDANDATALWSISGSETYNIVNKSQSDNSKNAYLRNNGTYGFATYAQGTGGPLSLYKKVDGQVAVVKPAILGDTYFLESSEVSMTCTTDGAEIRYTLDGSDPTASSTLYENPFSLTATTTVKAIAVKGTDVSAIAEKEFTKATVKTVAEALAMSATEDVYVTGYISTITEVSTSYKNATYRISDDGTTTSEMIVYHGKYLNNTDFTEENKNNIHVGDKVIVRGGLVLYNSAMQLAAGNYLISIEYPEVAIPTFAPTAESFLESVEVSLACSTEGAEIRYTLDGTDPTATSTLYENPFALTATTTVKAIAIKGGTQTAVVSKTYTKQTVKTVAEALEMAATNGVYVQGIISTITEVSTSYKNATYRISDNGFTDNEMIVYHGKYLNNTDFTAVDQIELGDEVIVYGNLVEYNNAMQLASGNYLVSLVRKASAGLEYAVTAVNKVVGDADFVNELTNPNSVAVTYATSNDQVAEVANDGTVTIVGAGSATITASFAGNDQYKAAEVSYTLTVSATVDTRKIANSPAAGFTTTSGDLDPADIAFEAFKGGAGTAPGNYNNGIRLYQAPSASAIGGYITLTAVAGCTIDEVQITTTNTYATTVTYSVDGNETLLKSESVAKSGSYTTGTGLNVQSVNIVNKGTSSSGRLEIASIKVYYTGEAATIDHYELGGTYATEFEVGDDFNHTGLIVYAAYDALGENKVDITSACTFSTPDMSTEGQKTIDITYKDAVVKSYTITVNASTDTRKIAESPATFTTVSGDMTPADITFASYKGGAGNDPYLAATGIRLYQAPSADAIGGFITLKAKKGCTIDQVKITTTNTYATTVAYSVDGNENLLGSESVAKSSDYSTPSGLNVESVNIVNKGTGSSGRLEIASIKVWYTGDALPVHHYILGGTYETVFEQFGTFSYEGLTVTAAYDELETITEAVTGFTVEADLSTAGEKKAEVMLNSVKIAEYDITVTESPKEDPALAYSPASVILTLGEALSAPVLSNTYNVSPITYNSDKPAVATVDAEGNISLAGGIGVAVITASFAGDDNYIESEATFTITVNEPAEDLSGTWVLATSVAVGDRIIIGATYQDATKTMGAQNTNNRAAVASTYENLVLTPAEGTKTFTLVDAGDGKFAIQALNGKYLTASGTGTKNYLTETADYEADNAKWTISFEGNEANVVASSSNRNTMRYNSGDGLFSCYATGSQRAINIYKKGTPDYGSYNRDGLTGNYGTICLPNGGTIEGATLFDLEYFDGANTLYLLEVNGNAMVAGKPYIFLPSAAEITVTYTDNADADAGSFRGLVGSYTQEVVAIGTDDEANYILYNNAYYLVNSTAYVGANRAYIHMADVPTEPSTPQVGQAPRRRVAMNVQNEQVATGVDALNATEAPVKMIINGQLFILRGEKMYNANGQLVK